MSYRASNYDIQKLANDFEQYGMDYKNNLEKVKSVVDDVNRGHMSGKPAKDFVDLFNAKLDDFERITSAIKEFNEKMEHEVQRFNKTIADIEDAMR